MEKAFRWDPAGLFRLALERWEAYKTNPSVVLSGAPPRGSEFNRPAFIVTMTSPVNPVFLGGGVTEDSVKAAIPFIQAQLAPFVDVLTYGKLDELLHWRLIAEHPDIPRGASGRKPVKNKRGAITDPLCLFWLTKWNLQGYAVYVTANAYPQEPISDVQGYFAEDRVVRVRACVVDLDLDKFDESSGHPFAPLGWQHGDVAGHSTAWDDRWPLPTLQVESRGGPHFWWLYRPGEEPSVGRAKGINRAMARLIPSDDKVFDAAHVFRVPGFAHWKTGLAHQVMLLVADKANLYSASDLEGVLGSLGHPVGDVPVGTRKQLPALGSPRVPEVPMSQEEYAKALQAAALFVRDLPVTEKGKRGYTLYTVVCQRLHDLGLKTEHALPLLRVWADKHCDQTPSSDQEWPASDAVLMDKWERSSGSRKGDRGSEVEGWRIASIADDHEEPDDNDFDVDTEDEGTVEGREQESDHPEQSKEKEKKKEEKKKEEKEKEGKKKEEKKKEEKKKEEKEKEGKEKEKDIVEIEGPELSPSEIDDTDDRDVIYVYARHRKTLRAIKDVFARHPGLFQNNGHLCEVGLTSSGPEITPLTRHSIVTYMTDVCRFFSWKEGKWGPVSIANPLLKWLPGEMLDLRKLGGVKPLKQIATIPALKKDGTVMSDGYSPDDQSYYVVDDALKNLQVGSTKEEAEVALAFLLDIIAEFPLVGKIQKAAVIAAMLSPFCRRTQNGSTPMFLIDGNRPNIGKSKLMHVITGMLDQSVYMTSWERSEYGSSDRNNQVNVTSAFLSGKSILVLDNITGSFGDGTIDRLLTAPQWGERILTTNTNGRFINDMTVYGTANNVQIRSDLWRRLVLIRLVDNGPVRTKFRFDVQDHIPLIRKQMVEACFTILRAFVLAGRPCTTRLIGSFENWSRWVASALTWLGMPDVTDLVETEAEALEDSKMVVEREALINAVAIVAAEKKSEIDGVTAGDISAALEAEHNMGGLASFAPKKFGVLVSLLGKPHHSISRADVSNLLKRHKDNSVDGRVLVADVDAGHRRPVLWKVTKLADVDANAVSVQGPAETKQ